MAVQLSVAARNARLNALETVAGVSARLQIRSGPVPADCAAADAGTLLADIPLPADWMADAAGGTKALNGTWQANAVAAGTAAHFRLKDSAGLVTHIQGDVRQPVTLNTTAAAAANSAVLTFADTTGVVVGMLVTGAGVLANAHVVAVTPTTITMSRLTTAGVGNGVAVTFGGDVNIINASLAVGQPVQVTAFTLTDANA